MTHDENNAENFDFLTFKLSAEAGVAEICSLNSIRATAKYKTPKAAIVQLADFAG